MALFLDALETGVSVAAPVEVTGSLMASEGPVLIARLPHAEIGAICEISSASGKPVKAQVIAFKGDYVTLAPFDPPSRVGPGNTVKILASELKVPLPRLGGGVIIDALGKPLDERSIGAFEEAPVYGVPPPPLSRKPISEAYETGVRAIDSFLTIGRGQRVGIFAPPGTGKSTLLGMLARQSHCDVAVVALVGERGREVKEFIEEALGESGLKKAVLVVATSDESAFRRSVAAYTATAIAEAYRDRGANVLLLVDSLTRVARAIRELSLAAGEMPVRQGYTARVYSELPHLVERSGNSARGTMTAFYTVLTNGPSDPDPLADEIRSLLDGHIVLDDNVRRQGIRPSIDVLGSCSRLFTKLNSDEESGLAETLRTALARLAKDKDFLLMGGTPDEALSKAISLEPELNTFRNQRPTEYTPIAESREWMRSLAKAIR